MLIHELVQNALDNDATIIDVQLKPQGDLTYLRREEDHPAGFENLRDAWTLFRGTTKRAQPDKRGRFNIGDKLVIARWERAKVSTTTGSATCDGTGRHCSSQGTAKGSKFEGRLKLSQKERREIAEAIAQLLPPAQPKIRFNGREIETRTPDHIITATVPTEIKNKRGKPRRERRETTIALHRAREATGWILEMGLPVAKVEEPSLYDIQQRLSQNRERAGLATRLVQEIRAKCSGTTKAMVARENLTGNSVSDALESNHCLPILAAQIITERFGKTIATQRPEASKTATSHDYTIIPEGNFSQETWKKLRSAQATQPASKLYPSPKPYSTDGTPLRLLDQGKLTPRARLQIERLEMLASRLVNHPITTILVDEPAWHFNATYGPSGTLTWNWVALGTALFENSIGETQLSLLIHELGHEKSGDHLAAAYHKALTEYGARLAILALTNPTLFDD